MLSVAADDKVWRMLYCKLKRRYKHAASETDASAVCVTSSQARAAQSATSTVPAGGDGSSFEAVADVV